MAGSRELALALAQGVLEAPGPGRGSALVEPSTCPHLHLRPSVGPGPHDLQMRGPAEPVEIRSSAAQQEARRRLQPERQRWGHPSLSLMSWMKVAVRLRLEQQQHHHRLAASWAGGQAHHRQPPAPRMWPLHCPLR